MLRVGSTVVPVLFGLDSVADVLVEWATHLAPQLGPLLPGTPAQPMAAVGVVEVLAGLVVAVLPGVGGLLVAAWLGGTVVDLLLPGDHLDVALCDVALALAALTPARLATPARR